MYRVIAGRDIILNTESLDEAYLLYLHGIETNTPAINITYNDTVLTDDKYNALAQEWESLSPEEKEDRTKKVNEIRKSRRE